MTECPCKRTKCTRHGKCDECREHHKEKSRPVYCERVDKKEERRKSRQR